jgi:putative ABC transport system permease protein
MSTPAPRPGRMWSWLLAVALPGGRRGLEGQTIRGDLMEEFRERAAREGVRPARAWYRRQARGLAARYALRALGHVFTSLFQDVRLASRTLRGQAPVTIAIVLTVGTAVASNAALFSVIDGLLFRPLPYRDAGRLVAMRLDPAALIPLKGPQVQEVVTRAATTPSLVERVEASPRLLFDEAGPAVREWHLRSADLSHTAFHMLGVHPVLGRPFVEADSRDTPFAVLLGYDVWQTRFGGDPTIIDRLVQIPGTVAEDRWRVVGVMPRGFSFPDGANFWIPVYPFYYTPPVAPYARLAPGVSIEALRAELPAVEITPLREAMTPGGAKPLLLLLAATVLLLLVAWVQIAGLLVARATGRTTEIGVRLALGASRWRLTRQFGVESALLIGMALAVALVAAPLITTGLVDVLPPEVTRGQYLSPDTRVLVFTAILSALGLVAFTVLPADLLRRVSPLVLLQGGASGAVRVRATLLRRLLFVSQLAVATTLVYLSALAGQSYAAVSQVSPGFETADLYGIDMPRGLRPMRPARGMSRQYLDRQRAQVAETIEALRALPEVLDVGGAHVWPFETAGQAPSLLRSESDPALAVVEGRYETIGPGYARVMGIPILEGAEPPDGQLATVGMPPRLQLALVNRTLARHLEQFGPVIGQVVAITPVSRRYRVTGVIEDARLERLDRVPEPTVFGFLPPPAAVGSVFVRLRPGVVIAQTGVQATLDRIWGSVAPRPEPIAAAVHRASADYRARTLILAMICVLSLPLTVIGVAGALTYATRQRTRELAIELAIGAEPRDMERRVVGQALSATGVALVIGLAAGVSLGRLMSTSLYGVASLDPGAVAGCSGLILLVAWLTAWMPARHAGRINPAEALRES